MSGLSALGIVGSGVSVQMLKPCCAVIKALSLSFRLLGRGHLWRTEDGAELDLGQVAMVMRQIKYFCLLFYFLFFCTLHNSRNGELPLLAIMNAP